MIRDVYRYKIQEDRVWNVSQDNEVE
jgi:hypothetical protein